MRLAITLFSLLSGVHAIAESVHADTLWVGVVGAGLLGLFVSLIQPPHGAEERESDEG